MPITSEPFGVLPTGQDATLFTLVNGKGLRARITDYGGILVSLEVPDRDGKTADVVLGKDDLQGYLEGHPYFGCVTGRVAGRIGGARFTLDGETRHLPANKPPNCLHGGEGAFSSMLWKSEIVREDGAERLRLELTDPDGHNGFPGTVRCTVAYALLDDGSLAIEYRATTDKATPFNITNHTYFNLRGQGRGDVLGHSVRIFADAVGAVDGESTLLGRREPVEKGFNDYREPIVLKEHAPLVVGNADIHFFLKEGRTTLPKPAAVVREPDGGRTMEVFTTEPGVQFYAGIHLSSEAPDTGKGGVVHKPCDGLCLETQDYPDSVNHPEMGGAILRPGETFKSVTIYRFGVDE